MERTLILIKPDGLQRGLAGEIISRFERKGLKIIGLKTVQFNDSLVEEHYGHHKDKPFFNNLKKFISSAPVIAIALEGVDAIDTVRKLCGTTKARAAEAGSIRGDMAMSSQNNLVHSSDSQETAKKEIARFFKENELIDWKWNNLAQIYSPDEA